ncbi:unnamed protein product [Rhodiola kirilowii]
MRKKESHWWWFEGHKNSKGSPWLRSTIEELDEKDGTPSMYTTLLKTTRLIEEDADSFAQRAEMLYKKKPELISMVEDFYRAHRSLAERYDLVKAEPVIRLSTPPMPSPHASCKSKSEKVADHSYDTYSISSISEDYNDYWRLKKLNLSCMLLLYNNTISFAIIHYKVARSRLYVA